MIRTLMTAAVISMTTLATAGPGCPLCSGGAKADTTKADVKTTAAADTKACGAGCDASQAGAPSCCSKGAANSAQASLVSFMPKMAYKIGDQTTTCSKTAAALAEKTGSSMTYVVNGVEYTDKLEAMAANDKQLESYLMDLCRVQYAVDGECVSCPVAAHNMTADGSKPLQYRVGPAVFDNADDAIKASVMAWNASHKVAMEYAVGDELTTCSKSAGMMAEKTGGKVEYVVNGQRTGCAKTAAHMQMMARVQAALKAIEAVSAGKA